MERRQQRLYKKQSASFKGHQQRTMNMTRRNKMKKRNLAKSGSIQSEFGNYFVHILSRRLLNTIVVLYTVQIEGANG